MPASPSSNWKRDPARAELLALYAEVDALLADHACDASADCCHFARTGREPYPTAIELAEVEHAIAASGIALRRDAARGGGRGRGPSAAPGGRRRLAIADDDRRCALLSDDGRCRIYASRPLGCRSFFCDRMRGPGKLPRDELQRIARAIADLSARHAPRDPRPRPLSNALEALRR